MDSLIEMVGPFGHYQKFVSLALGFLSALTSITVYSTIFILANPPLTCMRLDNVNASNNTRMSDEETCVAWKSVIENQAHNQTSSMYDCQFDTTYYSNTV
jgi:hypothetical protein